MINRIALHGGSLGLRDQGSLESTLGMPRAGFGGTYCHETIFDMAAAYLFHVVKKHPFVDGNKRIGLACALVFLQLSDIKPTIRKKKAIDLTMQIAFESMTKADIAKIL